MTFDLSTAASLASLFCLPATIAAIPGVITVFSSGARDWLNTHPRAAPAILVIALILAFLVDAEAKFGYLPQWSELESIANQEFKNRTVAIDGKDFEKLRFRKCYFCIRRWKLPTRRYKITWAYYANIT
jgi:hypothetical protein